MDCELTAMVEAARPDMVWGAPWRHPWGHLVWFGGDTAMVLFGEVDAPDEEPWRVVENTPWGTLKARGATLAEAWAKVGYHATGCADA